MNDTLGLRQVYAPRYIRYATRHIRLKPEIRTRYVLHYLPRYTSLRTSLLASLRTSLRTPGVVGSLQGQADVAEQRRGAARHSEAQRGTESAEVHRDAQRVQGVSESVRDRQRASRQRAIACAMERRLSGSNLLRVLPALEQRDIHFALAAAEPCYVFHYSTRKRLRV